MRALFPFLNTIRLAYESRFDSLLRAALPLVKTYNDRQHGDPRRLELFDIKSILAPTPTRDEVLLLDDCLRLRRATDHVNPGGAFRIVRASERWERLSRISLPPALGGTGHDAGMGPSRGGQDDLRSAPL